MFDPLSNFKLNKIKKGVDSVKAAVDALPTSLSSSFTDVKNAISGVGTKVDSVGTKVDGVQTAIDSSSYVLSDYLNTAHGFSASKKYTGNQMPVNSSFSFPNANSGNIPYVLLADADNVLLTSLAFFATGTRNSSRKSGGYLKLVIDGKNFFVGCIPGDSGTSTGELSLNIEANGNPNAETLPSVLNYEANKDKSITINLERPILCKSLAVYYYACVTSAITTSTSKYFSVDVSYKKQY